MLLAEANQWPEDAIAYFGDGDECHMAFNFPLMPRLFMGLRMEDRFPIIDILRQTPPIPDGAQWALFLRNHDELTLEMVTDEERDYMYRVYAHDTQARINLGIRRRLAPLLGNNRRRIELMNGLLMSLPGTPVIYYGDEIGMGDNVYLGDRNSVRTPMQWNSGFNAGFSTADPERLWLPLISNAVYGYQSINVESQRRNPTSLLNWTRRLIEVRRPMRVFGRGTIEFLKPENHRVLAFTRRLGKETVLAVNNLAGTAQAATDLLAGRLQVMFSPASTVLQFVTEGKLVALASTGLQRASAAPGLTTISEAALPGFDTSGWFGLLAPVGTARDIIERIAAACNEAAKSPDIVAAMAQQAFDMAGGSPEEFTAFIRDDLAKWVRVAGAAGLKRER
jgi:trehalose synthase